MIKLLVSFFVVVAVSTVIGEYRNNDNTLQNFNFKDINKLYFNDLEESYFYKDNKEHFLNYLTTTKHNDNILNFLQILNNTELEEFLYIVLDVKSSKLDIENKLNKWAEKQSDNIKKKYNIFKAKEELRNDEFEKLHDIISSKFFPDAKYIDNQIIALFKNKSITKINEMIKIREIVKIGQCDALRQLAFLYPFVKSETYRCFQKKKPLKMNIIVTKIDKPLSPFGMSFKKNLKPIISKSTEKNIENHDDSLYDEQKKFNIISDNIKSDKQLRSPTPLPNINNKIEELNYNSDNYLISKEYDLSFDNMKQLPKYFINDNYIEQKKNYIPKIKFESDLSNTFNNNELYESNFNQNVILPFEKRMPFVPDFEKQNKRGFIRPNFERNIIPPFERRMSFVPDFEKQNQRRFLKPDFERNIFPPIERRMAFVHDFEKQNQRRFSKQDFYPNLFFKHDNENLSKNYLNKLLEKKFAKHNNEFRNNRYGNEVIEKRNDKKEMSFLVNEKPPVKVENDKSNNLDTSNDKLLHLNSNKYENEKNYINHPSFDRMYKKHTNINFKNDKEIPEVIYKRQASSDTEAVFDQLPIIREARPE